MVEIRFTPVYYPPMDKRESGGVRVLFYQMLPLLSYILIEFFWGAFAGMISALAVGAAEMAFDILKNRRFESFFLFDVLILGLMCAAGLLMDSPLLLLYKPAVFELSASLYLVFICSLEDEKLKAWRGRVLPFDTDPIWLKKTLRRACVFLMLHGSVSAATAASGSRLLWSAWNLLPYAAALSAVSAAMIRRRLATKEMLPECDASGHVKGKISRRKAHNGSKRLHPVVHLHVIDDSGRLLLQKRRKDKQIQPDRWDTSVGGHVAYGERVEQALMRESLEEIGFFPKETVFIDKYLWESDIEREIVFVFAGRYRNEWMKYQHDEISELRFWTKSEIEEHISDDNCFTSNFTAEFSKYFTHSSS